MINAKRLPLYPGVKRRRKHFSSVGRVGVDTGIDGYRKYHLNWFSNPESSSAYRIAIPNTVPGLRISTQLAINHRIPKLIPRYQKTQL
jgi:hypothetical protein